MEADMPPGWKFVTHLCRGGKVVTEGPCVCGSMTTAPFQPRQQIPLCHRCRWIKKPLPPIPAAGSPPLICVDVCNIPNFVTTLSGKSPVKCVKEMKQRVTQFMGALQEQAPGTRVAVFIPADPVQEGEELERWKANRVSQVERGERNVVPGLKVLIGDIFRAHAPAAEVFYIEGDFCGIVARYANDAVTEKDEPAAVLSKNRRFLRYMEKKFEIFRDFELKSGSLHWVRDERSSHTHMDLSMPISHPPMYTKDPILVSVEKHGILRQGHTSPALARLGPEFDANVQFSELRSVLYNKLGLKSVTESFPRLMANGSVEWTSVEVEGKLDPRLLKAMKKPRSLIKIGVKPDGVVGSAWGLHVFAVYFTVFRLCKATHPDVHTNSLVSMILKALWRW